MHKRIKEIASQANAWYPMGYPSGEGGDDAWKNLVIFEKEDLEKFAKLIIKECISEIHAADVGNLHGKGYHLDKVAEHIENHFGIKE